MNSKQFDCVIIGAGPAGLSVAYHLKKLGVEFALLDREGVGSSWKRMNDSLKLVSPWWTNMLPGTALNPFYAFKKHSRSSFVKYLESYYKEKELGPLITENVNAVRKGEEGYLLETSNGEIKCRAVVCASGYFGNPYIPEIESDGSVDVFHASSFKNVDQLLERGVSSVLVVGRRVTAGQLAEELCSSGISVSLSSRGGVEVKKNDTLYGALREQVYFFWESLKLFCKPDLKGDSYPVMDGGKIRGYICSGEIPVYGAPKSIESGQVFLEEGIHPLNVDTVWLATGYQPKLEYLEGLDLAIQDGEMAEISSHLEEEYPGLYFIGFDNLFNFTSRYLRGIRRDSRRIADRVKLSLGEI
ncbi:flavin-containing monooxygenase [Pseudoteredinibacter isoporae]|uniref:Putative flavoprotein involved in K+ transport n=1 Tax=Pseudoteredinibacter isoporae TaxID=570281 RepID=A0A7X0JVR5_9GAMM|nr:FAD-dependent oxidoreductase [Pseudoteredinibacter isoporae]MBB6522704.1 putative flavoprotein involved in K+ transport [Pseudoteredinibacter isoporae]NHO88234.1 NAD(P)-binding domain-containing protein [Pseudoteredinibacter isoporae]NIB23435.1 NAD(P)-binding domain-containing protein [Pseudoteredinibacter isoporae]